MSTDRGRRPVAGNKRTHAPALAPGRLQLAPAVHVEDGADGQAVLVGPTGRVQLNGSAVAILRLCDGSRSRAEVVAEMVRRSRPHLLVSDIGDFLDAARAREWIVEEAGTDDK